MARKKGVMELVEILLKIDFDEDFDKEIRLMMEITPELVGNLKKSLMLTHELIELLECDAVLKGLRGKDIS